MRIVPLKKVTNKEIIEVLERGGLIIYPSDTCYGVGCDPTNPKAVERLLAYKSRREGKAISIAVDSLAMAEKYVYINETALQTYNRFLPGPFTIVSKSAGNVAPGIAAENDTIGIRIPDSLWFIELVTEFGRPITATSANQSYQKVPYTVNDVLDTISEKHAALIDLVIDGGELEHNPPSTVIDTTMGELQVLRKGQFIPENAKVQEFVSESEEETIRFGSELMEKFAVNLEYRPLIFALQGDLGAGKTQFTKGVAASLGVKGTVQSPTFILSREYPSQKHGNMLYHIDTWRMEREEDLDEIGFTAMLEKKGTFANVIVIEWADKFMEKLRAIPANHKIVWIEIRADEAEPNRRFLKYSE